MTDLSANTVIFPLYVYGYTYSDMLPQTVALKQVVINLILQIIVT
jgi:hypothetical protein